MNESTHDKIQKRKDNYRRELELLLMEDHKCIHHNGPNPERKVCKTCRRRADLVMGWLEHNLWL